MAIRQPVVSVLGHVDHGKTKLLDRIRGTSVQAREAGAITQHIGATEVPIEHIYKVCKQLIGNKKFDVPGLLFIDTPGHHSFTTLRARGGSLADIAVLVIDIREGLMPQTIESIRILRQYKTPFVIALNKVDTIQGWISEEGRPFILAEKVQQDHTLAAFNDKRGYPRTGTTASTTSPRPSHWSRSARRRARGYQTCSWCSSDWPSASWSPSSRRGRDPARGPSWRSRRSADSGRPWT